MPSSIGESCTLQILNNVASQCLAHEHAWLDGAQGYVVCAFYTPDYLPHVLALKHSLEILGINHFLKRYEPTASWEAATRIKPRFIEYCLARFHPRHILYVDADAAVRQPPTLLDAITTDIAICVKPIRRQLRVGVGTVYVRNTPAGRRFVEAWRKAEKDCDDFAMDSEMVHVAINRSPGLSLTVLPDAYRAVGDDTSVETVIQHFRISRHRFKWRKSRKKVRRIVVISALAAIGACGFYFLLS